MLDHLQSHLIGSAHLLTALAALAFGATVIARRKGTRTHRWMGRCYLLAMLAMNATSLTIYEVFGGFGPFHWLALISLASILGGYVAAMRRAPGWIYRHAYYMVGSYVGLVAALAAEIASRIPGWTFGSSVVISSLIIIAIGTWLMMTRLPAAIANLGTPAARPADSVDLEIPPS